VNSVTIENKDIEAFIRLFERSDWNEMRLEVDGLQMVLSNDPAAKAIVETGVEKPRAAAIAVQPAPAAVSSTEPVATQASAAPAENTDGLIAIRAPNLGTFYRSPNPGEASYVEVGQEIGADSEVCLIEVMKLFTPVRAGVSGRIARICIEDGSMVEFDAPLFYVEPGAE
jgi:acetyl-CoA carboxylase biotin carboxyl carrier protein